MSMNVLLLGHTGFVGRHLYKYLSGKFKVVTASRSGGDITIDLCDFGLYASKFDGFSFDIVICSSVTYSSIMPNALDNARIAANVLEYFQLKVKQLIFISSVFATNENKMSSVYNYGKYMQEELIRYYYARKSNITILRFCQIVDIEGGSRKTQRGFHYMVDAVKANTDLNVFVLNDCPRSYIPISYVVFVVAYSISESVVGFHNVVLEPRLTLRELAELLVRMKTDYNANVNFIDKEALHYVIPPSSETFKAVLDKFDLLGYLSKFIK